MSSVVWRILVAAKFPFAAKIMFPPYKKDIGDAYDFSILLCGEGELRCHEDSPLIFRIPIYHNMSKNAANGFISIRSAKVIHLKIPDRSGFRNCLKICE